MLKGHEQFRLPDENKLKDIILEVNWSKDKHIKDCQLVRFHLPDGSMATVKRDHFMAALFAIGTEEQQRKMIPQVVNRSRHYSTVVSVKIKKDVQKGDVVTFPITLTLPTVEEEIIAEAKRDVIKSGVLKQ